MPTPAPGRVVELPPLRWVIRRATGYLLEAVVGPLAVFYTVLRLTGMHGALLSGLLWSYAAIGRRLLRRERVSALLVLGTLLFTARTASAFVLNSVFIYFLQPTLGTFALAGLFLISVPLGRPLAQRLAHDFCPLPEGVLAADRLRRFFLRISLFWAAVNLLNGTAALWMLLHASVGAFLLGRSLASAVLTVAAIAWSVRVFRRSLRAEGLELRWGASAT